MHSRIRLFLFMTMFLSTALVAISLGDAQAQPGKKGDKKGGGGPPESADSFIAKLMAFNNAKDGKLTKAELTDTRLHSLFERADTNKDGVVTREELQALFTREQQPDTGKGGFGDKGKGSFGEKGKGSFGEKGKGGSGEKGNGAKGGFPQPGVVLNPFMQDILNLNNTQRQQIAELQKDVSARLDKILTEDQRKLMRDMSGPKGFGDKKGPPFDKKGEPK